VLIARNAVYGGCTSGSWPANRWRPQTSRAPASR